ncbi:MAG TPA: universal stress protein [Polyangiales bacterium]
MEARTVVVGADFGYTGDEAIRTGLALLHAGLTRHLHVVHVLGFGDAVSPPEERDATQPSPMPLVLENLRHRVHELAKAQQITLEEGCVHTEVRSGDVLTGLLDALLAHRADLAIVGTHGRHGIDRWLEGSVAETLARSAECSVLIARPMRPCVAHGEIPEARGEEPPWRPTIEHPVP